MTNLSSHEYEKYESWWFSRTFFVTIGVLLILAFLIYTGHSAHLLGALPYLLLLACPLMHIFMHGGYHHHGSGPNDNGNETQAYKHDKHGGGCH
jgi:Protein of unknown function (DUF2933)